MPDKKAKPNFLEYMILMVLPMVVGTVSLGLGIAMGPFWSRRFDPDYIYLLSGLLIPCGRPAYYSDHPGATLHLLDAGVISFLHKCIGDGTLVDHVLSHPEIYLWGISIVLIFLVVTGLFIAGVYTCRLTNSLLMGTLVQLSPLLSSACMRHLVRVEPEPLLLFCSTMIGVLVLRSAFVSKSCSGNTGWDALMGTIIGLSIAAKITYLPLLVIPLVICRRWKGMLAAYGLAALIFVTLIFSPLVNTRFYIFRFAKNIIIHAGAYGQGEAAVFTWGSLTSALNLWSRAIAVTEWPVMLLFFLSVAMFSIMVRDPWFKKEKTESSYMRALGALLVVQVLQAIMVLKSPFPSTRYLIPSLGLTGAEIVLLVAAVKNHWPQMLARHKRRFTLLTAFLLCMAIVIIQWPILADIYIGSISQHPNEKRWDEPSIFIIEYSMQCSQKTALYFANPWAVRCFSGNLQMLYPRFAYFSMASGELEGFAGEIDPAKIFKENKRVLMMGTYNEKIEKSPWLKLIFKEKDFCVFYVEHNMGWEFEH